MSFAWKQIAQQLPILALGNWKIAETEIDHVDSGGADDGNRTRILSLGS